MVSKLLTSTIILLTLGSTACDCSCNAPKPSVFKQGDILRIKTNSELVTVITVNSCDPIYDNRVLPDDKNNSLFVRFANGNNHCIYTFEAEPTSLPVDPDIKRFSNIKEQ